MSSHSGISGNERANKWAKRSLDILIGRSTIFSSIDLIPVVKQDLLEWQKFLWPNYVEPPSRNRYFNFVNSMTSKPWFKNLNVPRRYLVAVGRLRSNPIRIGCHFARMSWPLPSGCEWGAKLPDLNHLLCFCPQLLSGRPTFFSILSTRLADFNPELIDLHPLIFNPGRETVVDVGRLFERGYFNNWFGIILETILWVDIP